MFNHSESAKQDESRTATSILLGAASMDQESWRRLYQAHASRVYRWCRRAGLAQSDAQDVSQEVFAAVARSIGNFRRDRPDDGFRKWLRTITSNKLRDYWRRDNGEQSQGGTDWLERLSQIADHIETTHEIHLLAGDGDSRVSAIERARASVCHRDWLIFEQTVIEERSAADVAQEMRVSRNSVYLVKSRILKLVREYHQEDKEPAV